MGTCTSKRVTAVQSPKIKDSNSFASTINHKLETIPPPVERLSITQYDPAEKVLIDSAREVLSPFAIKVDKSVDISTITTSLLALANSMFLSEIREVRLTGKTIGLTSETIGLDVEHIVEGITASLNCVLNGVVKAIHEAREEEEKEHGTKATLHIDSQIDKATDIINHPTSIFSKIAIGTAGLDVPSTQFSNTFRTAQGVYYGCVRGGIETLQWLYQQQHHSSRKEESLGSAPTATANTTSPLPQATNNNTNNIPTATPTNTTRVTSVSSMLTSDQRQQQNNSNISLSGNCNSPSFRKNTPSSLPPLLATTDKVGHPQYHNNNNNNGLNPSTFHIAAVNSLFSVIFPFICDSSDGMISIYDVTPKWNAFKTLLIVLGIIPKKYHTSPTDEPNSKDNHGQSRYNGMPYIILDHMSKGYLLYLDTILLGQSRLVLSPIKRSGVLESCLTLIKEMGAFDVMHLDVDCHDPSTTTATPLKQCSFFKIFPFFQLDKKGKNVEAGEGHGPRKEFFDLASEEMTSEWDQEVTLGDDGILVMLQQGSKDCQLIVKPNYNTPTIPIGNRIVIRTPTGEVVYSIYDHLQHSNQLSQQPPRHTKETTTCNNTTTTTTSSTISEDISLGYNSSNSHRDSQGYETINLILRSDSPVSCQFHSHHNVLHQRPKVCLFKQDPTRSQYYCWFNQDISAMHPSISMNENRQQGEASYKQQRQWFTERFALAGWIAAQSLVNGTTLSLPLPTSFFRFLLYPDTFQVTEEDLREFDPETFINLSKLKQLPQTDFEMFLQLEDLHSGVSKEEYIQNKLKDILLQAVTIEGMRWFRAGFYSTGIQTSIIFNNLLPHELQLITCGQREDGVSDFDFKEVFRIIYGTDFTEYPHSKVFTATLWKTVDEQMPSTDTNGLSLKRILLKFITGRSGLPSSRGQEVIRMEMPYTMMSVSECDEALARLPTSHTCDNTLEMPNYCQAMLFCSTSAYFKRKCQAAKDNCEHSDHSPDACTAQKLEPHRVLITADDKAREWTEFYTAEEKSKFRSALQDKIFSKLVTAIQNTNGYDLDEMDQLGSTGNSVGRKQHTSSIGSGTSSTTDTSSTSSGGGGASNAVPNGVTNGAFSGVHDSVGGAGGGGGGTTMTTATATTGSNRRNLTTTTTTTTTDVSPVKGTLSHDSDDDDEEEYYNKRVHRGPFKATFLPQSPSTSTVTTATSIPTINSTLPNNSHNTPITGHPSLPPTAPQHAFKQVGATTNNTHSDFHHTSEFGGGSATIFRGSRKHADNMEHNPKDTVSQAPDSSRSTITQHYCNTNVHDVDSTYSALSSTPINRLVDDDSKDELTTNDLPEIPVMSHRWLEQMRQQETPTPTDIPTLESD